jgi:hypothetical protein
MTASGGAPIPDPTSLPAVAGRTVAVVTVPRRNSDAGVAPYSIKSETYDPRSSKY